MTVIGGSLVTQALALASGTFGSLSGFCKYAQIDVIRLAFVEFCQENQDRYETWAGAWNAFWPVFKVTKEYKNL